MQKMLNGEKLPPLRIDAEPHRRCNLKCVHCARELADYNINEYSARIEVPEERWYEIARESGEMGVKSWNIAGIGEPMFKPDMMMKLMGIIKEYHMFGELTTNGWYWSEENMRKTIEMGWDSLAISIDGPDTKSHEAIRRLPGSYDRACKTVKRFAKLRKEYKTHLPNLTINVVLSKYNYNRLPELVDMTHKLGADVLFVEPMVVYSEYQRKEVCVTSAQRKDLKAGVEEAVKRAQEKNIYAFITCLDGDDEHKEFNPDLAEKGGEMRDVILKGTQEQVNKYFDARSQKEPKDFKKETPFEILINKNAPRHDLGKIPSSENKKDFLRYVMEIPCYYPWFYLMITAEGNAVHCGECNVFKDNIKDKNLAEIWWGKHLETYRQRHRNGQLSSFCEKCRPNVIGDMKLVRKSIHEYSDPAKLQQKMVKLMEHSLNLKRQLYYSEYGGWLHPIKNRLFPVEKSKASKIKVLGI